MRWNTDSVVFLFFLEYRGYKMFIFEICFILYIGTIFSNICHHLLGEVNNNSLHAEFIATKYIYATKCQRRCHYVNNTPVDLWWSLRYGRHWLHSCMAEDLSSSSFQISGGPTEGGPINSVTKIMIIVC